MKHLEKICEEVATIALTQYETHKYHYHFTLWGICYHWPEKKSEWESIIPALFEHAKENNQQIIKPHFLMPRSKDPVSHYTLLAMRNHSAIVSSFMSVSQYSQKEILQEILEDRKLLAEAANSYIISSPQMPRHDFFDFLLNEGNDLQNLQEILKFSSRSKPEGFCDKSKYAPLLERLFFRFDQSKDLFKECSYLLESSLFKTLQETHERAVQTKKITLNPELTAVHRSYASRLQEQPSLPSQPSPVLSPRSVFGKIRVKTKRESTEGFIDWEEYSRQQLGTVAFDPNSVLRQQLVNLILQEMLPLYRDSHENIYALLDERMKEANEEESKALNRVRQLFQYMDTFDNAKSIHHEMNVRRK
jgi:hypothetical protein